MSSGLIASDVVPIGGGYVILMAALAAGLRLSRRAPPDEKPAAGPIAGRFAPGWPRFAAQVVATAVGGYVLLMAVLVAFYYGVTKVAGHFLESGFTGCLILLAIALPVFAIASRVEEIRCRRPGGPGRE